MRQSSGELCGRRYVGCVAVVMWAVWQSSCELCGESHVGCAAGVL